MNNLLLLWKQVMRSPMKVGTVAPSSKNLAKALIEAADLHPSQTSVEVGGGGNRSFNDMDFGCSPIVAIFGFGTQPRNGTTLKG